MRDGQRILCGRLHNELAVLKEFKLLRDEEKERVEGRERVRKEMQERAREVEERERRERERQDIVAWRRNRIEVANLSRLQVTVTRTNLQFGKLFVISCPIQYHLQLEEELRAVLRERRERATRNELRIKFRRVQKNQKKAEAGERRREKHVEFLEREGRLEGLRRMARRRMGLHMMPKDSR